MIIQINVVEKLKKAENLLLGIDNLFEDCENSLISIKIQTHCRQAVAHIQTLNLLLNSENENGGKNDAENGGKPM